jgi:hypothetical protein
MLAFLKTQLGPSYGSDLSTEAGSGVGATSPIFDLTVRDDSDAALAKWAMSRFELAGLILPDLSLAFHDKLDECRGLYGWFRTTAPVSIDICGLNANRFLPGPKRLILHELAHAWTYESIDEETKRLFLEERGLSSWLGESVAWEERGFEQAAEIIAWALMDEERMIRTSPTWTLSPSPRRISCSHPNHPHPAELPDHRRLRDQCGEVANGA